MEYAILLFYVSLFFLLMLHVGKAIHRDRLRREKAQRLAEMKIVVDNVYKYRRNKKGENNG